MIYQNLYLEKHCNCTLDEVAMTTADVHHATNCEHGELSSGVEEGGAAVNKYICTK